MTRRRVEATTATVPPSEPAASTSLSISMASSNPNADLLDLQRQIQHLTALQEQTRARTAEPPLRFTQQPPQAPAAMNTLYDEWARNTPWEQAQAAAWYADLPGRYGNAVRAANVTASPSRFAAFGGEGSANTEPEAPEKYSKPFCDFLTENPTIFHAVKYFEGKLARAGFEKVCMSLNVPTIHPHFAALPSKQILTIR